MPKYSRHRHDAKDAQKNSIEHLMNSPHMFISVLDRYEAEEKGIKWPGEVKGDAD